MQRENYDFNVLNYKDYLICLFTELLVLDSNPSNFSKQIEKILKKYPKDKKYLFSRDELLKSFENLLPELKVLPKFSFEKYEDILEKLKLKPMRTQSGVATVTLLTKPFACPGKCIFCPNDVRMPKSYIATEPGAQRALANRFSPFLQTWNRLQALKNIGHPTDKIEILVLGGTWTSYPEKYQIWFISEIFRALNSFSNFYYKNIKDFEYYFRDGNFLGEKIDLKEVLESDLSDTLYKKDLDLTYNHSIRTSQYQEIFSNFIDTKGDPTAEKSNITSNELFDKLFSLQIENNLSNCKCVGLVLETRGDMITVREVLRMRKLGATKVQLGIQTLNDNISSLNLRGEKKEQVAKAFFLLRSAGFKIHGHIMPNLLGATPEIDLEVYKELFASKDFKPDELKIYPTSVIKNTKLYEKFLSGEFKPYEKEVLTDLISQMMSITPEYCRLTRIIRDIPSTEIEAGNKTTNLRQVVEKNIEEKHLENPNIRDREIKDEKILLSDLKLDTLIYETSVGKDFFLQYITTDRKIAGFLRLSLPNSDIAYKNPVTEELNGCAVIREVHVYGKVIKISKFKKGSAQHIGLGSLLISQAKEIARKEGFKKLAVISAIGTRSYYAKSGFLLDCFYQKTDLF